MMLPVARILALEKSCAYSSMVPLPALLVRKGVMVASWSVSSAR